ncbi:hypothetical protein [Streptomyces sp. NPDC051214]|uniref:hypothetical protein n=1 Tax=Streptomyces sp. NPDC051214 TaxID=3155282 RepID=UPI00342443A0
MSDRPQLSLLCGFLALLAVIFAVSYAVGSAVGPGAPGTQRTETETETGTGTGTGTHEGDMGDMHSGDPGR